MNVEFIRKLAKKLRRLRHEEHYRQTTWVKKTACGTAACIAGHAVLMAGDKLIYDVSKCDVADRCVTPNGRETYMEERAGYLLGVRSDSPLFSGEPEIDWPAEFAIRWLKRAKSPKGIAAGKERPSRIAADLLDAIADGKVSLYWLALWSL